MAAKIDSLLDILPDLAMTDLSQYPCLVCKSASTYYQDFAGYFCSKDCEIAWAEGFKKEKEVILLSRQDLMEILSPSKSEIKMEYKLAAFQEFFNRDIKRYLEEDEVYDMDDFLDTCQSVIILGSEKVLADKAYDYMIEICDILLEQNKKRREEESKATRSAPQDYQKDPAYNMFSKEMLNDDNFKHLPTKRRKKAIADAWLEQTDEQKDIWTKKFVEKREASKVEKNEQQANFIPSTNEVLYYSAICTASEP